METKKNERKIGIALKFPKDTCNDKNCPFHGALVIKNKFLTGKVVSTKMNKSAVIEREVRKYIPKFERYLKSKSRLTVHNTPCILLKEGDMVKVALTRPISKKKTYVVIEILNE